MCMKLLELGMCMKLMLTLVCCQHTPNMSTRTTPSHLPHSAPRLCFWYSCRGFTMAVCVCVYFVFCREAASRCRTIGGTQQTLLFSTDCIWSVWNRGRSHSFSSSRCALYVCVCVCVCVRAVCMCVCVCARVLCVCVCVRMWWPAISLK